MIKKNESGLVDYAVLDLMLNSLKMLRIFKIESCSSHML